MMKMTAVHGPFDHATLVNQAEEDENYDIPFIKGPIRERNLLKKMKLEIIGIVMSLV